MKVLVTGCCGYIGSHTCVELLENGYEVVGLDNFSNSKKEVLDRIHQITSKTISFYEGDMLDEELLTKIFETEKPECVIDFAAYKAVGESVQKPIEYYTNNVSSVLTLLRVMKRKMSRVSSSAVVQRYMELLRESQLKRRIQLAIRPIRTERVNCSLRKFYRM